jgi:hypothetical protein
MKLTEHRYKNQIAGEAKYDGVCPLCPLENIENRNESTKEGTEGGVGEDFNNKVDVESIEYQRRIHECKSSKHVVTVRKRNRVDLFDPALPCAFGQPLTMLAPFSVCFSRSPVYLLLMTWQR